MKTLYITRGNNIVVDVENNTCDRLESARQGIDYIYHVTEPMHIVYNYGEIHEEADCDANDIVITFYEKTFKNHLVVVKNDKWSDNLIEYNKEQQAEKERWADKKSTEKAMKILRETY